jgi:hypothetical protein
VGWRCASLARTPTVSAHSMWTMVGAVVQQELHKKYKDGKVAVESLTFGIPVGQCFGFLVRGPRWPVVTDWGQCRASRTVT